MASSSIMDWTTTQLTEYLREREQAMLDDAAALEREVEKMERATKAEILGAGKYGANNWRRQGRGRGPYDYGDAADDFNVERLGVAGPAPAQAQTYYGMRVVVDENLPSGTSVRRADDNSLIVSPDVMRALRTEADPAKSYYVNGRKTTPTREPDPPAAEPVDPAFPRKLDIE